MVGSKNVESVILYIQRCKRLCDQKIEMLMYHMIFKSSTEVLCIRVGVRYSTRAGEVELTKLAMQKQIIYIYGTELCT